MDMSDGFQNVDLLEQVSLVNSIKDLRTSFEEKKN